MNVLGIHIGHDSSACLVVDGRIVADVAEERFTRTKHYAGLPINAIDYCLSEGGLKIEDIDQVAVPSSGPIPTAMAYRSAPAALTKYFGPSSSSHPEPAMTRPARTTNRA